MMRVSGQRASIASGQLWRIAALAAAGAIGATSHAEAALYYWSDSEPGLSRPDPTSQPRRSKTRHHAEKKTEPEKESTKPQGPVIISISIDQQKLRLYDANGLFAESPISTGMRGHPTPMGVFSVIQKEKLHHSNIYSGAPMPFMQRITWSGIAIHAGVLPGYPASHGCIRMPMAFAMKMWNWTKMGARVVVTPGEITPASFSHPLLAALKVAPQPMAADQPHPDAPIAAKADKAADADLKTKPPIAEAALELRSTIGHGDSVKPAIDEPKAAAPLREQTRTADASNTLPASNAAVTMSDAGGGSAPAKQAVSVRDSDTSKDDAKPEAAAISQPAPATAKPDEVAASDDKPAEAKSSEAKSSEAKSAEARSPDEAKPVEAASADVRPDEAAGAEAVKAAAVEGIKADEPKVEAKAADVKAATAPEPAAVPAKKDQTRPAGIEKAAAAKPDPAKAAPKRSGQIAMFVSRKDSKLYVRQNLAPLFDMPVTIASSDRPLGTHVFTAQVDKDDANLVHWSVVSLPVSKVAERHDEDERASRRRKIAGVVEVRPLPTPDSPTEALDRLNLPADALARITEALSTGGSLIISDQGIAGGETGEGTDFIVSLR
jgi:lipoprotein-anchoring transpeptidase ErfK/SrfK